MGTADRGTAIKWENHTVPGSTAFVVELQPGAVSHHTARRHAHAALQLAEGR
jgi:hypothetical protein